MKLKLGGMTFLGATAAISTTLVGLGLAPSVFSQGARTVKIDGSSTVYPITEAVAEDFQKSKRGSVRVTVGVSGTGGGFKKFCAGETDISNASRPISTKEMAACKAAGIQYIELPVAYDALTVVVNKQNNWARNLTTAELKKIWEPAAQGKVRNWNQVRSGFPNAPLKLFGPGADSGTFDYFTEAINGKSKASRTDYTPSEDDNVLVQGVSRDKNAIGYFGYAYYEANKSRLQAVAVNGVMPSEQTVLNGRYSPLSRPLFIYVSTRSANRPEVKEFIEYYMRNGAKLTREVKFVPLPARGYTVALNNFQKRRVGTIFGGNEAVGLRIDELLRREARE